MFRLIILDISEQHFDGECNDPQLTSNVCGGKNSLEAAVDIAYDAMDDAGCDRQHPARRRWPAFLRSASTSNRCSQRTISRICLTIIEYEDAASAYNPEAFAHVIGRAIEELMKGGGNEQCGRVPPSDRPVTESELDKLHSDAFCDLEPRICDCESMAKIAAQIVTSARIDESNREFVFAVVHVMKC